MIRIQPNFKLALFVVHDCFGEVYHDVLTNDPKTYVVLEDEGIKHSMNKHWIHCPMGSLPRT